MKLVEERGSLVGALIAGQDDEVYAIASDGVVIRTRVAEIRATGRDTMGVALMDVGEERSIVAVARGEAAADEDELDEVVDESADGASSEVDVTDSDAGEAATATDNDQESESTDE